MILEIIIATIYIIGIIIVALFGGIMCDDPHIKFMEFLLAIFWPIIPVVIIIFWIIDSIRKVCGDKK